MPTYTKTHSIGEVEHTSTFTYIDLPNGKKSIVGFQCTCAERESGNQIEMDYSDCPHKPKE